jgi:hypothetical protein
MLTIRGAGGKFCDGLSRRQFLTVGALGGLALPQLLAAEAHAGVRSSHKAVILIYLPGGPGHQDTFDLKMDAPSDIRGEFKPIKTNVPGIEICEHLPRLAKMMDKVAVIRSLVGARDEHSGDTGELVFTFLEAAAQRQAIGLEAIGALTERPDIVLRSVTATTERIELLAACTFERLYRELSRLLTFTHRGDMLPARSVTRLTAHAKEAALDPQRVFGKGDRVAAEAALCFLANDDAAPLIRHRLGFLLAGRGAPELLVGEVAGLNLGAAIVGEGDKGHAGLARAQNELERKIVDHKAPLLLTQHATAWNLPWLGSKCP